jgi:tetratricopeptide (TPR) repeat protein
VFVVVALYAPFSRFIDRRPRLEAGGRLVLADWTNATTEADLAGVTELARRQLEQSASLTILNRDALDDVLRRMVKTDQPLALEIAREVAWRGGADGIISGRVWRAGAGYGLMVRLESRPPKPDVSGANWSRSYEARDRTELRTAIRDAANWVRAAAGEAARDISRNDRPVEEVTTSSWRALDIFSSAETLLRHGREEDALALLHEAVRIDPGFALAWMRLGDVETSRRRFAEGYSAWTTALAVYDKRRLTPREEYRLRGMFASDTEDYSEAERVYRLYLVAFPIDPDPYFYIARPLMMLGRVDDGIAMLSEAARREPLGFRAIAQLAMFHIRAERPHASEPYIRQLRDHQQHAWADCIDGARLFLAGQYQAALDRFERLEHTDDPFLISRAPALEAAVFADLGRVDQAALCLRRGIAADAARGAQPAEADKLLALADLDLRRGDRRGTRDRCIEASHLDRAPNRVIRAASLLARAGFISDAAARLDSLDRNSPARNVQIGRHRVLGEILLAEKRPREAWTEFQQAASMDGAGVLSEYVARGAEAAGEHALALTLYARMAEAPGYFWRYPDTDPPGAWADALARFVALAQAHATRELEPRVTTARQTLRTLRSAAERVNSHTGGG